MDGARRVPLHHRRMLDVLDRLGRLDVGGVRRLRFGHVDRAACEQRGARGGRGQFRQSHTNRHGQTLFVPKGLPEVRRVRSDALPCPVNKRHGELTGNRINQDLRSRRAFLARIFSAEAGLSQSGTG
jgi:hypothetical protein